jgi:hypothetical protein
MCSQIVYDLRYLGVNLEWRRLSTMPAIKPIRWFDRHLLPAIDSYIGEACEMRALLLWCKESAPLARFFVLVKHRGGRRA